MTERTGEKILAQAVRDLALPGEAALARKPAASHRPDELALEFDEAYTTFVGSLDELPPAEHLKGLQVLDSKLSSMSGAHNSQLWTEQAVKTDSQWSVVRALAKAVVQMFGWGDPLQR
jgi:hypothetical protein